MPEKEVVYTHHASSLGLDFQDHQLTISGSDMNRFGCDLEDGARERV
jgi:hypothetical protein